MDNLSHKPTIEDFLDGRERYKDKGPYGKPDSEVDIRRITGVLMNSRRNMKLGGLLEMPQLNPHSFSISEPLGKVFRELVQLCEDIGNLPEEKSKPRTERTFRRIVYWTVREINGLIVSGSKLTDAEGNQIEKHLNESSDPVIIGLKNSLFLGNNPQIAKLYLLGSDEEVDVPSEHEIIKKVYDFAIEKNNDNDEKEFYRKLLLDPFEPTFRIDLGNGMREVRLREILAYYIFTAHGATRKRGEMSDDFIRRCVETIKSFIGQPQADIEVVIKKIRGNLKSLSTPLAAGALINCYNRVEK